MLGSNLCPLLRIQTCTNLHAIRTTACIAFDLTCTIEIAVDQRRNDRHIWVEILETACRRRGRWLGNPTFAHPIGRFLWQDLKNLKSTAFWRCRGRGQLSVPSINFERLPDVILNAWLGACHKDFVTLVGAWTTGARQQTAWCTDHTIGNAWGAVIPLGFFPFVIFTHHRIPDWRRTGEAGHIFHRLVVGIADPDTHCQLRRKAHRPVIFKSVCRASFGRDFAVGQRYIRVCAKGWRACNVIAHHIRHHIGGFWAKDLLGLRCSILFYHYPIAVDYFDHRDRIQIAKARTGLIRQHRLTNHETTVGKDAVGVGMVEQPNFTAT